MKNYFSICYDKVSYLDIFGNIGYRNFDHGTKDKKVVKIFPKNILKMVNLLKIKNHILMVQNFNIGLQYIKVRRKVKDPEL